MANHELEHWKYHSNPGEFIEVPPDGCNDIIFTIGEKGNVAWHITELPETCDSFTISETTYLEGIRFHPATQINRTKMLEYMKNTMRPADEVIKAAGEFVSFDENLHQTLLALGEIDLGMEKCAANLGVGLRSLQRYTLAKQVKAQNIGGNWHGQELRHVHFSGVDKFLKPHIFAIMPINHTLPAP